GRPEGSALCASAPPAHRIRAAVCGACRGGVPSHRAALAADLPLGYAAPPCVLADLVRGERVSGAGVLERLGEDDAVDLAFGREQRAAGLALPDGRVEGVDVTAHPVAVVDVRAVGADPVAYAGGAYVEPAVLREAGDDGAVAPLRVPRGEAQ